MEDMKMMELNGHGEIGEEALENVSGGLSIGVTCTTHIVKHYMDGCRDGYIDRRRRVIDLSHLIRCICPAYRAGYTGNY